MQDKDELWLCKQNFVDHIDTTTDGIQGIYIILNMPRNNERMIESW